MNCEQVQSLLVSYLNNETTPSERTLMQAHLSSCTACQEELSRTSYVQEQVISVLQHRASQVAPSEAAWAKLEARLAEAAQPSPAQSGTWLSRLAPGVSRITQLVFGGLTTMRKPYLLAACMTILIITVLAISLFNTTQVSAHDILNKAYAARANATEPTNSIRHMRSEIYSNYYALPEGQGMSTTMESYADLQTGIYRTVITDNKTGKVVDAFAYDGANTYSQGRNQTTASGDVLTIYRTPQDQVGDLMPGGSGDEPNEQAMFEEMRSDPDVQLAGKETWADGHTVYVLQSQQPAKVHMQIVLNNPQALVSMYFDTQTYQQVGYRMTMEKDGQEILLAAHKTLVDELLPAGSSVAWDLSDLQGIQIIDDPERTHGDLLPEVISQEELAANLPSAYLLKAVPKGYTLEITARPKQLLKEPYFYVASYHNADNDYFVIEYSTASMATFEGGQPEDVYTTASGLVIYFDERTEDSSGKQYTSAISETSDGVFFLISSTLPRETVEAWAEELVTVK